MSNVTNIMLSDDSLGSMFSQQQTDIEGRLGLVKIPCDSVGGNKYLEDDLYLGAFNNLHLEEYIKSVKDVCKDCIEDIQLFVKEQDDDKWKEIFLGKV